ncbi:hypothetical protein [Anaeromyxobacter terrae]|uniref:hypothetical protein n=1 Tax=Anaeromyxobacter terrae TaxID=2925406 RepID=UPI001F58393E|nr:hypothetical protein [Anaeromyxobacter sp. SG22]
MSGARAVSVALAVASLSLGGACARRGGTGGSAVPGGTAPSETRQASAAGLHEPCPETGCATGQRCVEYCGIAGCGPGRPTFRTCEIRCETSADCPQGYACGTIADGPGRVCMLRDLR